MRRRARERVEMKRNVVANKTESQKNRASERPRPMGAKSHIGPPWLRKMIALLSHSGCLGTRRVESRTQTPP